MMRSHCLLTLQYFTMNPRGSLCQRPSASLTRGGIILTQYQHWKLLLGRSKQMKCWKNSLTFFLQSANTKMDIMKQLLQAIQYIFYLYRLYIMWCWEWWSFLYFQNGHISLVRFFLCVLFIFLFCQFHFNVFLYYIVFSSQSNDYQT